MHVPISLNKVTNNVFTKVFPIVMQIWDELFHGTGWKVSWVRCEIFVLHM